MDREIDLKNLERRIKWEKKKKKKKKKNTKGDCFFCGTPCEEDQYCYGCNEHICDECEERECDMPFGGHQVEEHRKEEE